MKGKPTIFPPLIGSGLMILLFILAAPWIAEVVTIVGRWFTAYAHWVQMIVRG